MRSYRELSLRYLKDKKGRSLTIILGIIISVALITGVFTLADSFKGKLIENCESISKAHADIINVRGSDVTKIMNNVKLQKSSFSIISGGLVSSNSETGENDVFIQKISIDELDLQSYENTIEDGELPSKNGDLIVGEKYLKSIGKNIGDTISVEYTDFNDGSTKEITGKVTSSDYSQTITIIVDESEIEDDLKYLIRLRYKNPKDIVESIDELGKTIGVQNVVSQGISENPNAVLNETYITLLGEDIGDGRLDLINTLKIVLIILVILSSVGLIYNGFMISISERKKEFSLLRAVGMSKKQIKNIVIKESCIIGVSGIVLGILSGIFGVYILLQVVAAINIEGFGRVEFVTSFTSILGSILVSIITICISIYIPLKRASKISPVDGVKNNFLNDDKIKLSKSKSILSIVFGSVGDLASKNLRRNKGRFRAVVLGFSLSIFIFVSFSSYVEIANGAMAVQDSISKYEIETNSGANLEKINEIQGVKTVYTKYDLVINSKEDEFSTIKSCSIDGENIYSDDIKKIITEPVEYTLLNTDKNAMKEEILRDTRLDFNKLEDGIVLQNKALVQEDNKKNLIDITNYKVGDKIDIEINYSILDFESDVERLETLVIEDVEIVGILEEGTKAGTDWINNPLVYVGDGLVNEICTELNAEKSSRYVIVVPENEVSSEKVYTEINANKEDYGVFYIQSQDANQRQWAKMMLVFKIGVYGFLILITFITLTNIISAVTSSIESRRKEIALLRSVGTSNKFIKKMIFIENLNYYLYSILFGGIFGVVSSLIITKAFSSMYEGIYVFPIKPLVISSILLLICVIIISKYSINKLCKNNIIEEIREE